MENLPDMRTASACASGGARVRKIASILFAALVAAALLSAPARARVPIDWLESGGTLFAGGGTNVSNGVFFPGTVIYDGYNYQGLPPLQIKQGTDLDFVNLDPSVITNGHEVISFKRKRGRPVFQSKRVDGPARATIITSHLKPGVYVYFCGTHASMFGRLEVVK